MKTYGPGPISAITGEVTGLAQVNGDLYVRNPGWIIMDAEVSPVGDKLYFVNAHFNEGPVSFNGHGIGVATWSEPEKHSKRTPVRTRSWPGSTRMAALTTHPASALTGRSCSLRVYCLGSGVPSNLVAKRASTSGAFGTPACIAELKGFFVEAPSLSYDGKKMYYHRKDGELYSIYLVTRP